MNSEKFYSQFFHIFLLTILIVVCYSGTLNSSWQFDDLPNIVHNKNIQISSLSWAEVKQSFRSPNSGKVYRPVSSFTFALNYLISGKNPISYHIFNIIVHIICSIFVYLIFIQILELLRKNHGGDYSSYFALNDIALLGALFWSLHPIHTQAVTYLVQRMASMAAMFYIMAFYCYIRFRRNSNVRKKILFLFLAFFFWFTGIFSKENVVLLPLVLVICEISFFRVSPIEHKKFFIFALFLFLTISIGAFIFMRGNFFAYIGYLYEGRPFTMWERLITQPIILCRYLGLLLYPIADHLSLESDIIASKGFFDPPITIFANLIVSTLIIVSIVFLRRFPLISFAVLFFFINHLVESSFIGLELYFEHRNYLPSMFLFIVIAHYFSLACIYYLNKKKKSMATIFIAMVTIILISEGNATYLRNDVWENEFTLLTEASEKNPNNIRPLISLGAKHVGKGNFDMAMKYFKEAEELYNNNKERYQKEWAALLYYNAGILHMKRDDYNKSIQLLLRSLEFNDKSMATHAVLGYLYYKIGNYDNAGTAFINAIQLNPHKSDLYNQFGRVLYASNKIDTAIQVFRKGIEVDTTRELQLNLVASYVKKDDIRYAKQIYYEIPFNEMDLAYLVYRACYFDFNNPDLLDKIAMLLIAKRVDYCEWKNKVINNEFPGLIYPDNFLLIENNLRNVYNNKISLIQEEIGEKVVKPEDCNLYED